MKFTAFLSAFAVGAANAERRLRGRVKLSQEKLPPGPEDDGYKNPDPPTGGQEGGSDIKRCLGRKLKPGMYLEPGEGICSGEYAFGLTQGEGKLQLIEGDDVLWSAGVEGDFLKINRGGALVLYAGDDVHDHDGSVWSVNCGGVAGSFVRISEDAKNVVRMVGNKGDWFITEDGEEVKKCRGKKEKAPDPKNEFPDEPEMEGQGTENEFPDDDQGSEKEFADEQPNMEGQGQESKFPDEQWKGKEDEDPPDDLMDEKVPLDPYGDPIDEEVPPNDPMDYVVPPDDPLDEEVPPNDPMDEEVPPDDPVDEEGGGGDGRINACRGRRLRPGMYLEPGEGICSGDYAFGLTQGEGNLQLLEGDDVLWSAGVGGDFLKMNRGGALVLYAGDDVHDHDGSVWSVNCGGVDGSFVRISETAKRNAVRMIGNEGDWFITRGGKEVDRCDEVDDDDIDDDNDFDDIDDDEFDDDIDGNDEEDDIDDDDDFEDDDVDGGDEDGDDGDEDGDFDTGEDFEDGVLFPGEYGE